MDSSSNPPTKANTGKSSKIQDLWSRYCTLHSLAILLDVALTIFSICILLFVFVGDIKLERATTRKVDASTEDNSPILLLLDAFSSVVSSILGFIAIYWVPSW
ncbi:hypothetical protein K7432_008588, partial [Basidiobolus ranarum]